MSGKKRALLLAGGGIKVAYQAGCLQVLVDEAGLQFDHVDAASGGCLNAAMLLSGHSGTEIADCWRRTNPFDMLDFNVREYRKLFWARSIARLDKLKQVVLPSWGLDWERIRGASAPFGTFNVYNFTDKQLEVLPNSELDVDLLLASVALPMWFPPVERGGKTFFDAVFATDCNVGEAVRRGADELWCIWTVAQRPDYRDGFLAQYFHIVETSASTRFLAEWGEVSAVNQLIDRAGADLSRSAPDLQLREGYSLADPALRPPPGRKRIDQHLIRQEVPLHYLVNLSQDRLAEAVELGVRDARAYCLEKGFLKQIHPEPPRRTVTEPPPRLMFREAMRGRYLAGASDPRQIEPRELRRGPRAVLRLSIHIDDLDRFLHDPEHAARVAGSLECEPAVGRMPIEEGVFQLFTIADRGRVDDPSNRRMLYNVRARSPEGDIYRLEGVKYVENDLGFDSLSDLTTLYSRIYRQSPGAAEHLLGAGVLRIHTLDFARQLASFRAPGASSPRQAIDALGRFGKYFAGRAWDVYARRLIDYAPV